MAKYYLLNRHFLKASDELNARAHEAGVTVEFEGRPGALMLPLDCAARDAKAAVEKSRGPGANADAKRVENHGRRGMNSSQRRLVAEAQVAGSGSRIAAILDERK